MEMVFLMMVAWLFWLLLHATCLNNNIFLPVFLPSLFYLPTQPPSFQPHIASLFLFFSLSLLQKTHVISLFQANRDDNSHTYYYIGWVGLGGGHNSY